MRDTKLLQVELELTRLLTTRHKFVCFHVTFCVDIDCTRSSEGHGFELHMRLTLYLESKNLEYQVYHLILLHILTNL